MLALTLLTGILVADNGTAAWIACFTAAEIKLAIYLLGKNLDDGGDA